MMSLFNKEEFIHPWMKCVKDNLDSLGFSNIFITQGIVKIGSNQHCH